MLIAGDHLQIHPAKGRGCFTKGEKRREKNQPWQKKKEKNTEYVCDKGFFFFNTAMTG